MNWQGLAVCAGGREERCWPTTFQAPPTGTSFEYDAKANETFGYVDLDLGHPEWGYIDLGDVEQLCGQMGLPSKATWTLSPAPLRASEPLYVAKATAAGNKAAIKALQDQAAAAMSGTRWPSRLQRRRHARGEHDALALEAVGSDDIDFGWDGPDADDPMTREQ